MTPTLRQLSLLIVICSFPRIAIAQRSVMLEDLTTTEVEAAITGGKTIAFVYAGGKHENRYSDDRTAADAVTLAKHNVVGNYIARRVAEQLGNALAMTVAETPNGDLVKKTGHIRYPGTISLSNDTFERLIRDISLSLISAGFKTVVIAGDHGGGQDVMKKAAEALDSEWSSKGVRIFFFPVYADAKTQLRAHFKKLGVPDDLDTQNRVEDASEVMSVDKEGRWVHKERLAPDIAKFVSPQLGSILVNQKIDVALNYIRNIASSKPR